MKRHGQCLARASEFVETLWDPTVELSTDPVDRAWQVAGIAPIGSMDQVDLLASTSVEQLLTTCEQHTRDAVETLTMQIGDPEE